MKQLPTAQVEWTIASKITGRELVRPLRFQSCQEAWDYLYNLIGVIGNHKTTTEILEEYQVKETK